MDKNIADKASSQIVLVIDDVERGNQQRVTNIKVREDLGEGDLLNHGVPAG